MTSKREQIILSDIALIEQAESIKTVKRTMQSYSDLQSFAGTQLPIAAVVGRLPVPQNKFSTRDGQVDQIISSLRVDVFIYFQENQNMDSVLSSILEELWIKLYQDPTRNDLCILTHLEVQENNEVWPPFVAFQLIINHQYKHTTEGI
jgi:hypothetical protein